MTESPFNDCPSSLERDRFQSFLDKPSRFSYTNNKKNQFYKKAGAGGIIVDASSGKLLVVKGTWKWSLPKGHLDKGEKYHQCAMREIQEETNLNVDLNITDRYIDVKKYVYYIILLHGVEKVEFKTNDPEEVQEVRWLPVEEIRELECNRQLEYVVNRWDYIRNIIENHKEKVTKFPLSEPVQIIRSPFSSDQEQLSDQNHHSSESTNSNAPSDDQLTPKPVRPFSRYQVLKNVRRKEQSINLDRVPLPTLEEYFPDYQNATC
jgi:ADP-ribose pyrophosphatase YjhB (NUDIX family)